MKQLTLFCVYIFTGISGIQNLYAALGEDEKSIELDAAALKGVISTEKSINEKFYRVVTITTDSFVLREYVAKQSGLVFGITWKGLHEPDLSKILGKYYADFSKTKKTKRRKIRGRGASRHIQSSQIIVHRFGHMRNNKGKAFVPTLVPKEIKRYEIR